jgi:hypothetical protein
LNLSTAEPRKTFVLTIQRLCRRSRQHRKGSRRATATSPCARRRAPRKSADDRLRFDEGVHAGRREDRRVIAKRLISPQLGATLGPLDSHRDEQFLKRRVIAEKASVGGWRLTLRPCDLTSRRTINSSIAEDSAKRCPFGSVPRRHRSARTDDVRGSRVINDGPRLFRAIRPVRLGSILERLARTLRRVCKTACR